MSEFWISFKTVTPGYTSHEFIIDNETGEFKTARSSNNTVFGDGYRTYLKAADASERVSSDDGAGVYFAQVFKTDKGTLVSEVGWASLSNHVDDKRGGCVGGVKMRWVGGVPADLEKSLEVMQGLQQEFSRTFLDSDSHWFNSSNADFEPILKRVFPRVLSAIAAVAPATDKHSDIAIDRSTAESYQLKNIYIPDDEGKGYLQQGRVNDGYARAVREKAFEKITDFFSEDMPDACANVCITTEHNMRIMSHAAYSMPGDKTLLPFKKIAAEAKSDVGAEQPNMQASHPFVPQSAQPKQEIAQPRVEAPASSSLTSAMKEAGNATCSRVDELSRQIAAALKDLGEIAKGTGPDAEAARSALTKNLINIARTLPADTNG